MPGYARNTDNNHLEILEGLRQAGCFVSSTHHVGGGFPDVVASRNGVWVFLEIKDGSKPPSARRLRDSQESFRERAKAPVYVVTSLEEALDAVNTEVVRLS